MMSRPWTEGVERRGSELRACEPSRGLALMAMAPGLAAAAALSASGLSALATTVAMSLMLSRRPTGTGSASMPQ